MSALSGGFHRQQYGTHMLHTKSLAFIKFDCLEHLVFFIEPWTGARILRSCALVMADIYKAFSVSMLIQRWPPPCPEIHIHQDMKGYNLSCISSSAHFLIRSYISSEL